MPAKNYQNKAWFDKVIAKIIWCSFLIHLVFSLMSCVIRLFFYQKNLLIS